MSSSIPEIRRTGVDHAFTYTSCGELFPSGVLPVRVTIAPDITHSIWNAKKSCLGTRAETQFSRLPQRGEPGCRLEAIVRVH